MDPPLQDPQGQGEGEAASHITHSLVEEEGGVGRTVILQVPVLVLVQVLLLLHR